MRDEARIERTEAGLQVAEDGWCILNLSDMAWATVERGGIWAAYETPATRSPSLGLGMHILYPGESPGYYHEETNQEGFLVISGECIAIVEGQERRMGPWDFLHSPPGTRHIIVGAGEGPCAIFMVGTRSPDEEVLYPADPVAARHGWSVERDTTSPREAYATRAPIVPAPSPWPLEG